MSRCGRSIAWAFSLALALLPVRVSAQSAQLVTESYYVPTADPDVRLYVRNKRPEALTTFTPDRVVLFVHGATYPSEVAFDLQVGGFSWMDYIAERGYDVYLMDVRGYGRSTRPPEMSAPPDASGPIVHTTVAAADLALVVDHILARRRLPRLSLIGWSWGTAIAGSYTAANREKVERLVLYAPIWLRETSTASPVPGLGAWRTVDRESARQRWLRGVPTEAVDNLIPSGWFDAWWQANMEADPVGAQSNPPVVRAPNGAPDDGNRFWGSGRPAYDPSQITVPVLVIHGEWDVDSPAYMSQTLFPLLTRAPSKRYVSIGEGTHTILLERNRIQLFREVQLFLDGG